MKTRKTEITEMAIDMPIAELLKYKGTNPCPADFDEFWNRELKTLDGIDARAELVPSDFKCAVADCFDLYFTSVKGARIHAKLLKPKNISGRVPAVYRFHGLSGASRPWHALLHFVCEGYCVVNLDCRGQGGFSEDTGSTKWTTYTTPYVRGLDGEPENMYYHDVFLDMVMMNRIVCGLDFVDGERVAVVGESQGGGLSIVCAGLCPNVRVACIKFPYLSDFKRVWQMNLAHGAYEGLDYYFRYYDPLHLREDEIFEKLGYIDAQNFAHRIKAKVIMGSGLSDTCCPPSTHFAVYNKIETEKKYYAYPEFGHEELADFDDIAFMYLNENI